MNVEEYYKMQRMEDRLWWFRGRRHIVLGQLRHLLHRMAADGTAGSTPLLGDIGCGTGRLMSELAQLGTPVGFDLSPVALSICKENTNGYMRVGQADAMALPIVDNSLDALTALDILEHLPDDAAALMEFRRILKPGGGAVLTVPAHPNLWGMHDIALHHKRRYKPQDFRKVITEAGFDIERFSYAMMPAYPGAWAWRKIKNKLQKHDGTDKVQTDDFLPPTIINETLCGMLKVEAKWLNRGWSLPFGLSLMAVVRKPQNSAEK